MRIAIVVLAALVLGFGIVQSASARPAGKGARRAEATSTTKPTQTGQHKHKCKHKAETNQT